MASLSQLSAAQQQGTGWNNTNTDNCPVQLT